MLPDSTNKVGVLIETVANDGAITQTTAQLTVLGDTAKKTSATSVSAFESFNKSLKSVGQQMTEVGRSMTTYITLPVVGIAAASTKMAMDFQQSMELLHTNAGVPQDQIARLSNQILDLAGAVGFSPNSLALAMFHISTAGQGIFTTAQQLDQLKVAAEGAAIGQANLDDTTYALTSTLAANVKGAQDYQQTMGTLLGVVQAGDMHLSDLNEVIGTGLMGTLSTFGVSLQSAGAALADFGDLGEKGAAAGTRLRMMLTLMASPSQAAAKILGDLGLTTDEVNTATGTMNEVFAKTGLTTTRLADDLRGPNGIYTAVTDLKTSLEKAGLSASQTDAVLSKAFGGGRTDAALLQLLNTTDRLDLKYQQIGTDAGNFSDNWVAQQQTMKEQWDKAWSGIQADMIRLGDAVMPTVAHAMTEIGKAVSNVADWFERLSPQNKQMVIDMAMVAAAAGPVLLIFGSMAKSLSSILTLTNTVGSGILGVGKLLGGLGAIGGEGAIAGGLAEGGAAAGGLVAALGPVALGIGAVGLAAGGAYLLVKHFTDANDGLSNDLKAKVSPEVKFYDKTAKELGYTLTGTASKVNVLTLAQTAQKDSANMLKDAQGQLKTSQEKNKSAQEALTKAVKDGKTSEGDYVDALHNAVTAALDLKIKEGNLADAEKVWTKNKYDFRDAQNAVTAALKGTLGVIAEFGPKALNQVKSIDTLQAHLSTVVKSFSSLVVNIQNQAPKLIEALQGGKGSLGNAVNNLQKASSSIDLHLSSAASSAKTIQNSGISIQGGSLQGHASGSTYAPGGLTVVGEQGPELVSMPTGSKVYPARQSARMMGGNNITINQTNNNYSQFDQTTANRLLGWQLANAIG